MAKNKNSISYFKDSNGAYLNNFAISSLPQGAEIETDPINVEDYLGAFTIEAYRTTSDGAMFFTVMFTTDGVNWDDYHVEMIDQQAPFSMRESFCGPKKFKIKIKKTGSETGNVTLFLSRILQP